MYILPVCMPRPVTTPTISPLSLMTAPPVFTVSLFGMSAEYACGKLRMVDSCVGSMSKLPPRWRTRVAAVPVAWRVSERVGYAASWIGLSR